MNISTYYIKEFNLEINIYNWSSKIIYHKYFWGIPIAASM
jgi:hypothetical protein